MAQTDNSILRAALIGYELRIAQLRSEMSVITKKLGTAAAATAPGGGPVRARRMISVAARKRIAAAQKKRWAAFRKQGKSQ